MYCLSYFINDNEQSLKVIRNLNNMKFLPGLFSIGIDHNNLNCLYLIQFDIIFLNNIICLLMIVDVQSCIS